MRKEEEGKVGLIRKKGERKTEGRGKEGDNEEEQ